MSYRDGYPGPIRKCATSPGRGRGPTSIRDLTVTHYGVVGNLPGGMAQVVNQILRWDVPGVRMRAIPTTRGRHDSLAPWLSIRAAFHLLATRFSRGTYLTAFHLSEGGSFLREGLLLKLAHAIGLPTVAHLHGAEFASFVERHSRLVRSVLLSADGVACLTVETMTCVQSLVPATNLVVLVPNGVECPDVAPWHPKRRVFAFGGEIGLRKGFDLLLSAWEQSHAFDLGWQLMAAGPADEEWVDACRKTPGVAYLGSLPHEDLLALLASSKIAVLPSRNEALPMFLAEAASRGCVLIGSDVGQVASIVTLQNGVLVPAGDVGALTSAIRRLAASPDSALQVLGGESWKLAASKFSSEVARDRLSGLWASCLARHSGRLDG